MNSRCIHSRVNGTSVYKFVIENASYLGAYKVEEPSCINYVHKRQGFAIKAKHINIKEQRFAVKIDTSSYKARVCITCSLCHRTNARDKILVYGLCDIAMFAVPHKFA